MDAWMKNLPDSLLISEINIPGTHDSCANHVRFKYFSKCQNKNISDQLKLGIRHLDIRVEQDGNRLKTVHGAVDCKKDRAGTQRLYLEDVLNAVKIFLHAEPSETVVICVKRDHGGPSEDAFDVLYENYLKKYDFWFTENRIPRLGEVRGRAVFVNRCVIREESPAYNDSDCGLNLSEWPEQRGPAALDYKFRPVPSREEKESRTSWLLQDYYRVTPPDKWSYAVLPLLDNAPQKEGVIYNYFSANNGKHSPKYYSRYIYRRFADYEMTAGKKYGWLILDYPAEEYVKKIVLTNF